MAEKDPQAAPAAAADQLRQEQVETGYLTPRTILEAHPGWRERTVGLKVTWKDDGLEVKDCSPEMGEDLDSLIMTVLPLYGHTPRMARTPGRPGIRVGF